LKQMTSDALASINKYPGIPRARWIVLIVLLVMVIAGVLAYWHYRELYPVTENAYARSGMLRIAAEVSGVVSHVYVRNDERVTKDEPLFDIDPTLYEAGLGKARAQFEGALSAAGKAGNALENDAIQLNDKGSALNDALKIYRGVRDAPNGDRQSKLDAARKDWEDTLAAFRAAQTKFDKDSNSLVATTPTSEALLSAANQLEKVVYEWSQTHVTAPASGWLSQMTLQPGAVVRAGTPLFVIVKGDEWWVNANFKETDLSRIKVGQNAKIRFDMYPGLVFDGVVEGISEASGATFSILPHENATGNWIKVAQRFTVQIRITDPVQHQNEPLRVGASATVTVDTVSH
jgi:membrane fusion protein (multidrug efflux system)